MARKAQTDDLFLERLQEMNNRLLEWVEQRGTAEVAQKSGFMRQALYQVKRKEGGTRTISADTLLKIKMAYGSEFDLNFIMTGEMPVGSSTQDAQLGLDDSELIRHMAASIVLLTQRLYGPLEEIK